MREIGRYLVATIVKAADADTLPRYRSAGRDENVAMQTTVEKQKSSADAFNRGRGAPPLRLGLAWRTDDAEPGSIIVTGVAANSPAAVAGLSAGDSVEAVNGQPFANEEAFHRTVSGLLDAGAGDFTFEVESRGHVRTVTIHWHPARLTAKPST